MIDFLQQCQTIAFYVLNAGAKNIITFLAFS